MLITNEAECSAWTEADSQTTSLLSAHCFYWAKRKKSNEVSYLKRNTSVLYLELREQSSARSSPLKTDMRSEATQKHNPNLLPPWNHSLVTGFCFHVSLLQAVTGTDTCQLCLALSRQDEFREAKQHWDCPGRCQECFQLLQLHRGSKHRGAKPPAPTANTEWGHSHNCWSLKQS